MFSIKNIQISIVIFMILLFVISLLTIFHISERQIIIFLVCQILLILIPGFAAVLSTKIKLPLVSMFCYSYMFGYVINIFEYFAIKFTENIFPLFVIPLIVLVISGFVIYKKKNQFLTSIENSCSKEQLTLLSFLGLFLFLNIFVFALGYVNMNNAGHDFAWWCANSVSLKLSFPPEYAFMKGVGLYYHYFSNIQIAFFNLISTVDIKNLSIPFYALTKTIMMIGAVDFTLNILKIKDAKIKAFVLTLVLLTTGFELHSIVTYFHHIFFTPFGFDIGFALGFVYTAFLVKQFYEENFDIKTFIPCAMFYFVCAGAKSPISHVLLILTALLCLYWLVKKQFLNAFLYGLTALLSCSLVSIYFVGANKVLSETSETWRISGLYTLSDYGHHPFLNIISKILSVNVSMSIITILSIVALVILLTNRVKFKINDICLAVIMLLTYFIGTSIWLILNVGGHSEMYYAMASLIPLTVFNIVIYKIVEDNSNYLNKTILISFKTIAISGLILGIVLFSFCAYGKTGIIKALSRNFKKNISYKQNIAAMRPLIWIKNNTPKNSIILADNLVIEKDKPYYLYGILTERWQYLEEEHMLSNASAEIRKEIEHRKEIIKGVFANDENILKQLKHEGVNYIISTHDITPDFSPNLDYLELVAESKKFKVYKVK